MIRSRRSIEEFSISFLDVICCGFGAVILLLMISQNQLPILMTQTTDREEISIDSKENELETVIKSLTKTQTTIEETRGDLSNRAKELAEIQDQLNTVRARFETLREVSDQVETQNM